jgi:hypothetical protein
VIESVPPVPDTFIVIVIVEGSFTATLADMISWPPTKLMLGTEEVLTSNPLGIFKTMVALEPEEISDFLPSAIVMGPKVVHAPDPPVAAVSAESADPPEAAPTEIAAWTEEKLLNKDTHARNFVELVENAFIAGYCIGIGVIAGNLNE